MRNSPWFLLLLAIVTVSLAGAALTMPLGHAGGEAHLSPWDLLLEWRQEGRIPKKVTAQVLGPQTTRNGILQGLHIRVRVLGENGTPIQGSSIVCDRILANSLGRSAAGVTNADGEFATTRLVPGTYEMVVTMPGYLASEPQSWTLPADGGEMRTVQMTLACQVKGSLQGQDGLPQNQGILLISAQDRDRDFKVRPDTEGNFHFPALPEGRWILSWIAHAQADPNPKLKQELDLVAGSTSRVQVILPAELLTSPLEQSGKDVGIYLLEND
ncbi:MAG: carboxypeptidase-like regulatory domain-containing protein [Planctomycetota bacterium]